LVEIAEAGEGAQLAVVAALAVRLRIEAGDLVVEEALEVLLRAVVGRRAPVGLARRRLLVALLRLLADQLLRLGGGLGGARARRRLAHAGGADAAVGDGERRPLDVDLPELAGRPLD